MQIKIKKLHPDAVIPEYQSAGAACFDLHAIDVSNHSPIYPGIPRVFRTGLAFEIPPGFAMLVFSRSGHGFKSDVRLSNCVGVIDHDYRGEVRVKLARDDSSSPLSSVMDGDRVAQAMIVERPLVSFVEVDELEGTERGENGFGSTGA